MDIFDDLIAASSSKESLSSFLDEHIQELYDFLLTQKFEDLNSNKSKIETYIFQNLRLFRTLDFSNSNTITFITLLLDVSERFSFFMPFQRLYRLLEQNHSEISNRHQASALFLIGIQNIANYEERIINFLEKLSDSYENEEDNEDRIVGTIVNYYAQVVNNFANQNQNGVQQFKENLISQTENFHFLKNTLIQKILNLEIVNNVKAFAEIQYHLDVFLKRTKTYNTFLKGFLIEENTDYSLLLEKTESNFLSIQELSAKKWQNINDNSVFYSLQRGVKVLTEENQLFSYLYSYGKMHYNKMTSSFDFLPKQLFDSDLEIIDWGCGQGLASISFLDYFSDIISEINNITLIEPSEIALKRASLHVKKINETLNTFTINKDLDSLIKDDFKNNKSNTKVHLFSNILDIDLFSLTQLVDLLKTTFKGVNYFVIASPYVSSLKTSRLDIFVNSFSKSENFELINKINNRKGEWNGTNWTRVIRIFKVELQ